MYYIIHNIIFLDYCIIVYIQGKGKASDWSFCTIWPFSKYHIGWKMCILDSDIIRNQYNWSLHTLHHTFTKYLYHIIWLVGIWQSSCSEWQIHKWSYFLKWKYYFSSITINHGNMKPFSSLFLAGIYVFEISEYSEYVD